MTDRSADASDRSAIPAARGADTNDATATSPGRLPSEIQPTATGPESTLTCAACGKPNKIRPSSKGAPHCGNCAKPLPWLVPATDATFDIEADAAVAVLVDLWAPWCGPCRFVGPILEELSREYAGRLKVVKVNVDDNPATMQRFQAFSIPTLVVIKNGRPVDRIVGAMPKSQLAVRLTPHLLRS